MNVCPQMSLQEANEQVVWRLMVTCDYTHAYHPHTRKQVNSHTYTNLSNIYIHTGTHKFTLHMHSYSRTCKKLTYNSFLYIPAHTKTSTSLKIHSHLRAHKNSSNTVTYSRTQETSIPHILTSHTNTYAQTEPHI